MQKIYLKLAQYPFMKKTLNKVRIEGKLFKLIKGIYKNKQTKKPIANILTMVKDLT